MVCLTILYEFLTNLSASPVLTLYCVYLSSKANTLYYCAHYDVCILIRRSFLEDRAHI